jgi:hypothetical protein
VSLETPEKIRTLQTRLYAKAKAEPAFRFYLLYDKVYREDVLDHAYRVTRDNRGAPGVDGVTFADIEAEGSEKWLASLRDELRAETYKPQPVRRVMIPKPGGCPYDAGQRVGVGASQESDSAFGYREGMRHRKRGESRRQRLLPNLRLPRPSSTLLPARFVARRLHITDRRAPRAARSGRLDAEYRQRISNSGPSQSTIPSFVGKVRHDPSTVRASRTGG